MPVANLSARDVYGLRSVAALEWLKAAGAMTAGVLLAFHPHASFGHIAERILHALHIKRNSEVAIEVIRWARKVNIDHVNLVLAIIALYVIFRIVEGWGLWYARQWAEWFGIINGVLYLPLEATELFRRFTWIRLTVLLINIIVVLYLAWELRKAKRHKRLEGFHRSLRSSQMGT